MTDADFEMECEARQEQPALSEHFFGDHVRAEDEGLAREEPPHDSDGDDGSVGDDGSISDGGRTLVEGVDDVVGALDDLVGEDTARSPEATANDHMNDSTLGPGSVASDMGEGDDEDAEGNYAFERKRFVLRQVAALFAMEGVNGEMDFEWMVDQLNVKAQEEDREQFSYSMAEAEMADLLSHMEDDNIVMIQDKTIHEL